MLTELPKIITDLGWVGVAMGVAFMFATNRWYSSKQVDRLLDKEREVTEVWKQNAGELKPLLEDVLQALRPLGQGDAAVLKCGRSTDAASLPRPSPPQRSACKRRRRPCAAPSRSRARPLVR
jgi:hypothetical protein